MTRLSNSVNTKQPHIISVFFIVDRIMEKTYIFIRLRTDGVAKSRRITSYSFNSNS